MSAKKTANSLATSINWTPYWADPSKKDDALASSVFATVQTILSDTLWMRHEASAAAALYNNTRPMAVTEPARVGSRYSYGGIIGIGNGLSLNVIKSCTDTPARHLSFA